MENSQPELKIIREIAITVVLCLATFITNAQHFYTGVRIGTSLWLAKYGIAGGPTNPANSSKFSFDGEAFVRRNFKNDKWAVELSLGYTPFRNCFWKTTSTHFNGYTLLKKNNDIHFYEADITVFYDASSPLPGYFIPYLSRLKSYIGFSLIPTFQQNHESYLLENAQKETVWQHSKDSRFTSYLGLSYNHLLPVSKHWSINSLLAVRVNLFDGYIDDNHEVAYPNMRISWEAGIAYKW